MNTIDIRGKELYIIKRILNRQESRDIKNHFTIDDVTQLVYRHGYASDFISTLESKGLIYYSNGYVYITDLAKSSIDYKEKKESRLINEQIIDDYEYAFLQFMHNRNEPVPMFHFPYEFQYHSKIHMQPVEGSPNTYRDWFDEVYKYVEDPTVDGFILNHIGRTRFEKLKKEKELKIERENLEMQKLRTEVENLTNIIFDYPTTKWRAKYSFYLSILAVIIAGLVLLLRWIQPNSS